MSRSWQPRTCSGVTTASAKRAWASGWSPVHGVRRVRDPRDGATPAGRFRTALEIYDLADPAREAALRADRRAACAALGLPLPTGEHGHDAETEMLLSPWTPADDPDAVAIQRLGRDAEAFATGIVAVDLDVPDESGRPPARRRRAARQPSDPGAAITA